MINRKRGKKRWHSRKGNFSMIIYRVPIKHLYKKRLVGKIRSLGTKVTLVKKKIKVRSK